MHRAMLLLVLLAIPLFGLDLVAVQAGPPSSFACSPLPPPLAHRVDQSDATLVVKCGGSLPRDEQAGFSGETLFVVVEVLRDVDETHTAGEKVTYPRDAGADEGCLYLLIGRNGWDKPIKITAAALQYVKDAPSPEKPAPDRLRYFFDFLEHEDEVVSHDAHLEFEEASLSDVVSLREGLSRETLRRWLEKPDLDPMRIGRYSLLLGLAGNEDDAAYLEAQILKPTQDYRPGVEGMVFGYLMLTGEAGLGVIDREKLADTDGLFIEVYPSMLSVRFLWDYVPERIPKDRLRASMRIPLDRPDLTDLVVINLARWGDWSVADRLMEMYDDERFGEPIIKRSIVRYYLIATLADKLSFYDAPLPAEETVAQCAAYLAELRERDPETVRQAERFFFLVE